MRDDETPKPVAIQICILCRQPWDNHLKMAKNDILEELFDLNDKNLPVLDDSDVVVKPIHCVRLLLIANQGPSDSQ